MTRASGSVAASLVRAYEDTDYVVALDEDNRVICRVGERRPAGLPGASVTVVTAWNPGALRPGEQANQAANRRLQETLGARHIEFLAAWGQSRDKTHVEPSFAAIDLSRAEAVALGREFAQAAVFWVGEGRGELLWCG